LPATIRMLDRHDPADPRHNRILTVDVGDGAQMTVPAGYWLHRLVHETDGTPPGIADDRSLAASCLESYRFLIMNCTKEEAWHRLKMLREVIENEPTE
jgi:hypothetical protein